MNQVMSRIKLNEQYSYEFKYTLTVQAHHLNYAGHLGHSAIIDMVWEARSNMFRGLGISEGDLGDGKTGIIMGDLVVNFKSEAFIFDKLVIESHVNDFHKSSFRIFHRITKGENLVALVETGFITFNYSLGKIVQIPQSFMMVLEKYI